MNVTGRLILGFDTLATAASFRGVNPSTGAYETANVVRFKIRGKWNDHRFA